MREPGASPGRSRRCEGRCLSTTTPLADGREGGARGEPRVRRPAALRHIEPLAEGRIRVQAPAHPRHRLCGARRGRGRRRKRVDRHNAGDARVPRLGHGGERQGHARPRAAPHRVPVGHGDGVTVRDRRRRAGHRGRRPVRLPEERAEDDALGVHAERRGDRRLPARSRDRLVRSEGPRRRARAPRDPGARPQRGDDPSRRVPADPATRNGDRQARRRGEGRRADEGRHREDRRVDEGQGPRPDRLPRADARSVLGRVEHVHRRVVRGCSACGTSRTPPTARAPAIRSSRRSTSWRRARTSSCSPTRSAAGRRRRPSLRGRAGARSPR